MKKRILFLITLALIGSLVSCANPAAPAYTETEHGSLSINNSDSFVSDTEEIRTDSSSIPEEEKEISVDFSTPEDISEWEIGSEQGKTYVITLASDVTVSKKLRIPEGVTAILHLNGKTLSGETPCVVENNGTLTVEGEGKIVNTTPKGINGEIFHNNGELTLNGGSFFSTESPIITAFEGSVLIENGVFDSEGILFVSMIEDFVINNATVNCDYCRGLFGSESGGNITVNGGTYTVEKASSVLSVIDSTLTLNGGTVTCNEIDRLFNFGDASGVTMSDTFLRQGDEAWVNFSEAP